MITKAFIYKEQDYKESSKLLYCYTPYGKYTLVARGAKSYKNNYFHLAQYFNLIEIDLNPNKSMQTLKEASLVNDFLELKKDYQTLKIASNIGKLIDDLVFDIEVNERLFNLVMTLLDYKDIKLAYLTFVVKLTYVLGISLTFHENYLGFHLKSGQTTTNKSDADLDNTLTTYLKLLYFTKEEVTLNSLIYDKLYDFMVKYYVYHLDYKLKQLKEVYL